MTVMTRVGLAVAALLGSLAGTLPARATTLFTDSFQGMLNQWSNPINGGVIVTAPDGSNALTFNVLQSGNSVLTTQSSFTSSTGLFTLTFDIYANCGHTSQCGAFFRASGAQTSADGWVLSDTTFYSVALFPDAPNWETVSYTFAGSTTTLGIEDTTSLYAQPYPSAAAIYVRNLTLTNDPNGVANGTVTVTSAQSSVPEPLSLAVLGAGFAGLGVLRRGQFTRGRRKGPIQIELRK